MTSKTVATKKPATKKPAATKKKKNPDCPFLFYGYDPAELNDGPYIYEARFKEPFNEARFTGAANSFEYAVADSAVEASGDAHRWHWSGPWIAFRVDVADGCDAREMHADIRAWFQTFIAWDIQEVIFHGVRVPGTGEWDRTTVEMQPEPSAAPAWPGFDFTHSYYGATQPRVAVESTIDEGFEAKRAAARKPREVARPGEPALVRVKDREIWEAVPEADRALVPPGHHVMYRGGHRSWVGVRSGSDADLWWIDDGTVTKVHVPGFDKFSIAEDGSRALAISHDEVREIVPPSTALPEPIFSSGDKATIGAWYAADDTIAMLHWETLRLFGRQNGTLVELDRVAIDSGTSLGVFRGGTIAVVTTGGGWMSEKLVHVFRVANQKLTALATFKREGSYSFALDGKIYVATLKCMTELVNV